MQNSMAVKSSDHPKPIAKTNCGTPRTLASPPHRLRHSGIRRRPAVPPSETGTEANKGNEDDFEFGRTCPKRALSCSIRLRFLRLLLFHFFRFRCRAGRCALDKPRGGGRRRWAPPRRLSLLPVLAQQIRRAAQARKREKQGEEYVSANPKGIESISLWN